jgi:pimeloyl-ACP methyl ester carboxylesterase
VDGISDDRIKLRDLFSLEGVNVRILLAAGLLLSMIGAAEAQSNVLPPKTFYRTAQVGNQKIFYREAGNKDAPTIVLLHGYPSSSHTYRELIPLLSTHYHVIAPDYLGSGYSDRPDPDVAAYTFDRLADYVEGLLKNLGVRSYTLYMQDFGAPVGFRLMQRNPDAIRSLVIQNANAYLDGLTPQRRDFFRKAHDDRSPQGVASLFERTGAALIIDKQYLRDVPPEKHDIMSPDAWTHDLAFLRSEKDRMIQVQLFQDYQTNIDRYPDWQALLRQRQYPALIVWGKHDPAFIAAGAEAYLRDLPKAELHLLDAGHFAVEEMPGVIAQHILAFMARN